MAFIEGIGDEVVLVVGTFIALVCLSLAWFSTQVRERPRPEVVVLDRSRIFRALQRIRSATTNTLTHTPVGYVIRSANANASASNTDNAEAAAPSNSHSNSTDGSEEVSVLYAEVRSTDTGAQQINIDATRPAQANASDSAPDSAPVHDMDADRPASTSPLSDTMADSGVRQRKVNAQNDRPAQEINEAEAAAASPPHTPAAESASSEEPADIPDTERLDGHIRVRLKYLNERQRLVQCRPESTIEQFKRVFFDGETSAGNMSVRLIYNGQELHGERTLQSYNVADRCVIHCLLSRSISTDDQRQNQTVQQGLPFDMGALAFPLFGLILALIWYCRVAYRSYFNAMSTFSLVGITFLFTVALMASFRGGNRNAEQHVH